MDRYWLLTWTTYGTWLPGDRRGFVSNVRDGAGPEVRHNIPGTPCDADDDRVRRRAQENLVGEPVWLTPEQATIVVKQFRQTAAYRGWSLLAVAVMANHIHLVVGVLGDPDPAKLLHDFKSYATRALKAKGHQPRGARWWTESGSRRKLPDERAVRAAVGYVLRQERPLTVWSPGERGVSTPCLAVSESERESEQGVDTPRSPAEGKASDLKSVLAYTRGIATPGSGAFGAILTWEGRRKELSGGETGASNNRMDLVAAVEALKALNRPCRVTLYNSNGYLIEGMSKGWASQWRDAGWITREGKPTAHADLWDALLELSAVHTVEYVWLPADGVAELKRCDELARAVVREQVRHPPSERGV